MAATDVDTEEPDTGDQGGTNSSAPEPKGRRLSFGKVRRELTEDELGSSGVQKMLLDELDRMDGAEIELKTMSTRFHETNAALAVSQEKLKTHNAFDIISTGGIASGSLLFGVAFSLQGNDKLFWVLVALSVITVLVGILAKVIRA
ncbi:hypothetical protein [Phyllobacterium pellucidum]|uniref:hypothetical protein n=1 Tax=Phyllobacterium pellucidum TaxID=2740464 RepID=UPI001D137493|nr:hypothetical protein [Phyllobacterium sp. T1018]UGY08311.1 hypothetical protein LLE51_009560 [Phyllobacterium sp. T1018]